MHARAALLLALAMLAWPPSQAHAGAWTLAQGHWQIITSTFISRVGKSFDASGKPSAPADIEKTFTGVDAEYGVLNGVTLIFDPQYSRAVSSGSSGLQTETDTTIEAGARVRLFDRLGVMAVQATYETAGGFGDTASDPFSRSGARTDVRLLYGWDYRLFGHPGFMEVEGGYRLNAGRRPNEVPFDATVGFWVIRGVEAFVQSYTIVSTGTGRKDYGRYMNHKVEFSLVGNLTRKTSLQLGAFVSPDGRNTWKEQGLMIGLWYRF